MKGGQVKGVSSTYLVHTDALLLVLSGTQELSVLIHSEGLILQLSWGLWSLTSIPCFYEALGIEPESLCMLDKYTIN